MRKRLFVLLAGLFLLTPVFLALFSLQEKANDALLSFYAQGLRLLGESSSPQVIVGKNGFLFFEETTADYLGTSALSQGDMDNIVQSLAALSEQLQAENRAFYVLIAPNKNTIYEENMPARYLKASGESNLDRLQNALAAKNVSVLDAKKLLMAQKSAGLLYFKEDTHWNARGAQVISDALLSACGIQSSPAQAFLPGSAGDLKRLLFPANDQNELEAVPEQVRAYRFVRPMRTLDDMTIVTASQANQLSLLVIRDSFGKGLFPYLANQVGYLTYSRVYESILEQARTAKADVVVLEIAERNIKSLLTLP